MKKFYYLMVASLLISFVGCRFDSGVLRALPMFGIMLFGLSICLIGANTDKKTKKRRRSH